MLDTIVGFIALAISIFAVIISMIFYFKSNSLYKEMLIFVTEIRTYSLSMYKDTVGMVKQAWPHVWKKAEREIISEETREEKEKIKDEITKDIMVDINKIKEITSNGIKTDQLKNEITNLERKFTKAIEEAFGKIEAIDRKGEKVIPSENDIDREIMRILYYTETFAFYPTWLLEQISGLMPISSRSLHDRIRSLKERKLCDFDGDELTAHTLILVNRKKLGETLFM